MDSAGPSTADLVALDIDVRLHNVILWALEEDETNDAIVAAFLRLAYVSGYADALSEASRGQLFREHGFAVPSTGLTPDGAEEP